MKENVWQQTVPKSPELMTKARRRLSAPVLSSEQREELYMNSVPTFKALPFKKASKPTVRPPAPASPPAWKPVPLNRRILARPDIVPRQLKFRNNPITPPRGLDSIEFFTPLGNYPDLRSTKMSLHKLVNSLVDFRRNFCSRVQAFVCTAV